MKNKKEPYYPRPSVTADLVVVDRTASNILLIRRKNDPFKDYWALPGGFLDLYKKELIKEAAIRELKEETNINYKTKDLDFFGYFDAPKRDPREHEDGDNRTIAFGFLVYLENIWRKKDRDIKAMDDATEFKWASWESCINNELDLAFDHSMIIKTAFDHIQLSLIRRSRWHSPFARFIDIPLI